MPSTPELPKPDQTGYALVNGAKLWYAIYGHGDPVIFLHGGLANSNYWGQQVAALKDKYKVILIDSRGHGRSSRGSESIGYDVMTEDVVTIMDQLKLKKAAVVGWSDGAILGLELAIHHPERLTGVFAFAANTDPSAVKSDKEDPLADEYYPRFEKEYATLSPNPNDYKRFYDEVTKMWASQPHITEADLKSIVVPVCIAVGDHDEAVERSNTLFMADQIPNSALLIEPAMSHYGFLQDPTQFNNDVLRFLERTRPSAK